MEKQTLNAVKLIHKFNKDCGLLEKKYSDFLESSFQIEEALEGFDLKSLTYKLIDQNCEEPASPKEISREIALLCAKEIADVDRLDKHLDSIVYNFGSLFKLGLTPQEAIKALTIVAEANMQKLTAGKDEHGKQKKPEGFIPPEDRLQKILDEVKARQDENQH